MTTEQTAFCHTPNLPGYSCDSTQAGQGRCLQQVPQGREQLPRTKVCAKRSLMTSYKLCFLSLPT